MPDKGSPHHSKGTWVLYNKNDRRTTFEIARPPLSGIVVRLFKNQTHCIKSGFFCQIYFRYAMWYSLLTSSRNFFDVTLVITSTPSLSNGKHSNQSLLVIGTSVASSWCAGINSMPAWIFANKYIAFILSLQKS